MRMRWLAAALAFSFFAGCFGGAPCRKCEAQTKCDCSAQASCGGKCGNCLCAAKWFRDAENSGDYGLWSGEAFLGRWEARTGMYRAWDGKSYGKPVTLAASGLPRRLYVVPVQWITPANCST